MISKAHGFFKEYDGVDVWTITTDEAVQEIQKKLLAIKTDITKWQQKQNINNNLSATVPYKMERMRNEIKEFMDDLTDYMR
ncbi:MAG: hypothetical protein PUF72_01020 [Clostridiales bacterium]|nr:hypothetical protein [Clostridiales bacterium]